MERAWEKVAQSKFGLGSCIGGTDTLIHIGITYGILVYSVELGYNLENCLVFIRLCITFASEYDFRKR